MLHIIYPNLPPSRVTLWFADIGVVHSAMTRRAEYDEIFRSEAVVRRVV